MADLRSGAAVFGTGSDGVIAEWNDAAERLTGIRAEAATGRHCWDVIRGRDDNGHLVCHPGCSAARLARQGWPVQCTDLRLPTPAGAKRVTISTIVVCGAGEPLILHPLRERVAPGRSPEPASSPTPLTPRQREILALLAAGMRAREIAARLVLSETTVRNHIRAILVQLGVHSQLEAVARARSLALVRDDPAA
jgi:DNA-binding CsgD family transcriptional regulator